MIIPSKELEFYQQCPARWSLREQYPIAIPEPTDFVRSIRSTIFHMYARLMSDSYHTGKKSVKDFWDEAWWVTGMNKESGDRTDLYQKAADGWIVIEKFYENIYKNTGVLPVGINFEFSNEIKGIDYRVSADLILSDRDGTITVLDLGGKRSEWQLYTSLATKVDLLSIMASTGVMPTRKTHIDLVSRKTDYSQRLLNVTPEYIQQARKVIEQISSSIMKGSYYAGWSENCKSCPCAGKCWV